MTDRDDFLRRRRYIPADDPTIPPDVAPEHGGGNAEPVDNPSLPPGAEPSP